MSPSGRRFRLDCVADFVTRRSKLGTPDFRKSGFRDLKVSLLTFLGVKKHAKNINNPVKNTGETPGETPCEKTQKQHGEQTGEKPGEKPGEKKVSEM